MSDTILYKSGFCCNISDRNFSALKSQTQCVIIWQTTLSPIFSAIKSQTHCVIIWPTILRPLLYAITRPTTGSCQILSVIIKLTNSVIKCQTDNYQIWHLKIKPLYYYRVCLLYYNRQNWVIICLTYYYRVCLTYYNRQN